MRFKFRSSHRGRLLHSVPTDTQRAKSRDMVKRTIERSNSREPLELPRDTGRFPKEAQTNPFPTPPDPPPCDDK